MSSVKYIWTNHARKRLNERKIPQAFIDQALHNPDKTIYKSDGARELQKRIDNKTVAAIVKKDRSGEFIIKSCWINPPYPGTKDFKQRKRYLEMQKASWKKKLWLMLLNQLGL